MWGLLQVVLNWATDVDPIHPSWLASAGVLKAFANTLLAAVRSAVSNGGILIELSA